ncbi:MAG: SpoIIE family protein phosphatase [Bacteroidota bacterium]
MSRLTKDNQIKRLTSIIEASKLLNSTLNLRKVLKIILELATKHSRAAKGTIYLVDHHKKEIWSEVQEGKERVLIHLPFGRGIAGTVAKTGDSVNIGDAYKDSRFYAGIDERTGFRTKSMICMPMRNDKGKIVGVFQLLNKRGPISSGRGGFFTRHDEEFLETLSVHAALAIEKARLHQEALEKEAIEKEIEIAVKIQQLLLPERIPPLDGFDISAVTIPSKRVGGDFYDVIRRGDQKALLVIADVSGKGIPAAMLVSTLQAWLHAFVETGMDLLAIVERLNKIIYEDSTIDKYITFFICELDTERKVITSVNAGHNYPLLFRADGPMHQLEKGGLSLGMFPDEVYVKEEIQLGRGDVLVLYTDGVTEAMNKRESLYGETRFYQCLCQHLEKSAREIQDAVRHDVQTYIKEAPQADDITMMVLKVT